MTTNRYIHKPIRVEAIQHKGANWREIVWDFLGLNREFDNDDMRHNVYPSESFRVDWLNIPRDLKEGGIGDRECVSVMRGEWIIVYDGRYVETMSDVNFRGRFDADK